jgi:ABC-type lipoprotein export system ATPase subunit
MTLGRRCRGRVFRSTFQSVSSRPVMGPSGSGKSPLMHILAETA